MAHLFAAQQVATKICMSSGCDVYFVNVRIRKLFASLLFKVLSHINLVIILRFIIFYGGKSSSISDPPTALEPIKEQRVRLVNLCYSVPEPCQRTITISVVMTWHVASGQFASGVWPWYRNEPRRRSAKQRRGADWLGY